MGIREYLVSKKEEIKQLEVKPRVVNVEPNKNFILSIVGPRRSGKTFFLYFLVKKLNLFDKDFLFVNFEEITSNLEELPIIHKEIYGEVPGYLFLDEIQSLRNWERFLYRLYESKKYYIFVTGSSSKLLSKEIVTQLRGRSIPIYIYPLSFKEVLLFREFEIKKEDFYNVYKIAEMKNLLLKVLENGSFPDIVLDNAKPFIFFKEYWDLIVYKDIVERYGIKNRYGLEFFMKSLLSSFSKKTSMKKILNSLKSQGVKISKTTLYNFQKILEDTKIFFFLRKYDKNIKRIEVTLPKIYCVDNGLYTYIERKREIGKLMENFVFLELVKKGYEENRDVFYVDFQSGEIDFLVKEGLQIKQLIQVTYASNKDEIEQREIKALEKTYEIFKKDRPELLIITWDYEDVLKKDNLEIKCIPLWKWLLNAT